MITIETLTGSVNLRTGSAKCSLFHTPRAGGKGAEERLLGLAVKSGQTAEICRSVSPYPTVIPAVQGYSNEVGGKMVRMIYQVAEGEILKIFAQRRPGAGKLQVTSCQFLQCRESAALTEVEIKLLTDAEVNEPFGKIRGRFDLITLAEALAQGVKVQDFYQKMFGEGPTSQIFTASVIAPATVQVKKVPKADGTLVNIAIVKRRRTINIQK